MYKYKKYLNKNQNGGNNILLNIQKYKNAYELFIVQKVPINFNTLDKLNIQQRIMPEFIKNFNKINLNCYEIQKDKFTEKIKQIIKNQIDVLDFDNENFEKDYYYNYFIDAIKSFHISTLQNCIKYENFDFNHVKFSDTQKYNIVLPSHSEIPKKLEDLKNFILQQENKESIIINIFNIYGNFDEIFNSYFCNDLFESIFSDIQCAKIFDCFLTKHFDLTNIYAYDFPQIINENQNLVIVYNNIKQIYLPIALYTYDSDILYEMNKKMLNMYNHIDDDFTFFNDKYIKISFVILNAILQVKNIANNNTNTNNNTNNKCSEILNTTISKFTYKPYSKYCYRGFYINGENFDTNKLQYQVKINSFSKKPSGVLNVLEVYFDKLQIENYDTIIILIAENNNNFIPIQFFNPQIKVASDEEEVITLPFVKYDCELVFEYYYETKNINIYDNDIIIDLKEMHNDYFSEINKKKFNCKIFKIKNIENLIMF